MFNDLTKTSLELWFTKICMTRFFNLSYRAQMIFLTMNVFKKTYLIRKPNDLSVFHGINLTKRA